MKIGITGIKGKMARALALEIINHNLFDISGALVRQGYDEVGEDIGEFLGLDKKTNSYITDNMEKLFNESDVIIDFSSPELTMECAKIASKTGKTLITGTTGLNEEEKEELIKLSVSCVIIHSDNMSIGANLLCNLIEEASSILRDGYDTEILEINNRQQDEEPSNTALMLGKAIANGKNLDFGEIYQKEKNYEDFDIKKDNEISFSSIKGGDSFGDYSVLFMGTGERLEFSQKTTSPIIFIKGAIRATIWSVGKKYGLYTMQDVLRIRK